MITTAILAFREFLEAFLILGIFFGISKKLQLKKEKEIGLAALVGLLFSLLLPIMVFLFGERTKTVLSEKNADLLEGYLLVFSGVFIAYVVFSLHRFMKPRQKALMSRVQLQMTQPKLFDVSLFLIIVFFIMREGFEVALLTATTSLFSLFLENVIGLLIGFGTASIIGILTFFSYLRISVGKIFKYTEYAIVIFGAAMVKNGISILSTNYFNLHLEKIIPLSLQFLPSDESIAGHILKNLLGFEKQLSIATLAIMTTYIVFMYFLFHESKKV